MVKRALSHSAFPSKALLAVQAALFIAYHGGEGRPISGAMMEKRYRLSRRAMETVLQPLARAGIVHSQPGAYGGYIIPDASTITLADIVDVFTDTINEQDCTFTHFAGILTPELQKAQLALIASLKQTTLKDVCNRVEQSGLPAELDVCLDYMI